MNFKLNVFAKWAKRGPAIGCRGAPKGQRGAPQVGKEKSRKGKEGSRPGKAGAGAGARVGARVGLLHTTLVWLISHQLPSSHSCLPSKLCKASPYSVQRSFLLICKAPICPFGPLFAPDGAHLCPLPSWGPLCPVWTPLCPFSESDELEVLKRALNIHISGQ